MVVGYRGSDPEVDVATGDVEVPEGDVVVVEVDESLVALTDDLGEEPSPPGVALSSTYQVPGPASAAWPVTSSAPMATSAGTR